MIKIKGLLLITFYLLFWVSNSNAQIEKFNVTEAGKKIEVWRITNNPTIRDWANYHNTKCWSPNGRYLVYTHFASDGKEFGNESAAEVHLFDIQKKEDIFVGKGIEPRWANNHNWIFYLELSKDGKTRRVVWYNIDKKKKNYLEGKAERLKETDYKDEWLYGFRKTASKTKGAYAIKEAVRISIKKNAKEEVLWNGKKKYGWYLFPNPNSPIAIARDSRFRDMCYDTVNYDIKMPFVARHFFKINLDGTKQSKSIPIMEGSHFSPDGAGKYFMAGNGPTRGFKFDDSFPGNLDFLSNICVGDIGVLGRSGRWLCGSTGGGNGPLQIADMRSGEGWVVMKPLSVLCYPGNMDNSGEYDNDAKGSPDGTKVAFVSTYDLKDGPVTVVTKDLVGDNIIVQSTEGFPNKGRLVQVDGFRREVISYENKTETSFKGIKRGLYGTPGDGTITAGRTITSFESRIIPLSMRDNLPLPSKTIQKLVKNTNSPLRYQRSSDLYSVVVRKPDAPYLRKFDSKIELIPGENHWETMGYILFRNGEKVATKLYQPGETITLTKSGNYQAMAVEYSGLEGKKSSPLKINAGSKIKILKETPSNFSWISSRYLVAGKSVTAQTASLADETIKEIIHLYDGIISKEWSSNGIITKKYDLNPEGKPIRKLFYTNGILNRREYWDKNNNHISTELYNSKGDMIKSIHINCEGSKIDTEWDYVNKYPVKCSKNKGVYKLENDKWIKVK